MSSIDDFLSHVESKIGCGYIFGAQGETLEAIIRYYAKNKLGTPAADMLTWLENKNLDGIEFYDCSGLIVKWLLDNGYIASDMTADGLYKLCTPITAPVNGALCFLVKDSKAYHVGVYKDGCVINALNVKSGVVSEPYTKRAWSVRWAGFAFENPLEAFAVGVIVKLVKSVKVYSNSIDAKRASTAGITYLKGNYTIYKISNECANITKTKNVAGGWISLDNLRKAVK